MNRTLLVFVAIALGFVPGLLVGMAFVGGEAPADVALAQVDLAAAEPVRRVEAPPPSSSAVVGEASTPSGGSSSLAEFREILRTAERPDGLGGAGVIEGVVEDDEGKPLSGVTVRATLRRDSELRPSSTGDGVPTTESLEDVVRHAVESHWRLLAETGEAVTDGDGAYALTGLAVGLYSMSAYADGWTVKARSGSRAAPGQTKDFDARPIRDVRVEVVLEDGRTVSEAGIAWRTVGSRRSSSTELWRRDDPCVRLAPGVYELTAYLERKHADRIGVGGDWISEKVEVDADEAAPETPVRLVMRSQRGVRGRVVAPAEENLTSARVWSKRLEPGEAVDVAAMQKSSSRYVRKAGLEFEVLDLEPGRYAVGAGRSWENAIAVHTVVDVGAGVTPVELALPPLDPSRSFIAHVRDVEGKPLRRVTFRYWVANSRNHRSGGLHIEEEAPGRYRVWSDRRFQEFFADPEATGTMRLTANTKDRGSKSTDLPRGTPSIEFVFAAPATLEARVPRPEAEAAATKLRVTLRRFGTSDSVTSQTVSDGRARLGPIEAGEYEAVLTLRPSGGSYVEVAKRPVSLSPGKNEVVLSLPPLYELTVRVELSSTRVNLTLEQGGSMRVNAKDGEARFEKVMAGLHTVRASIDGAQRSMQVRVPQSSVVDFVPEAQDAARVSVSVDGGWLSTLGFRDGDLIVAVGGRPFETERQLKAFLIAAGATAPVTVVRGDRSFDLTVDGERLSAAQELGGSWTSAAK